MTEAEIQAELVLVSAAISDLLSGKAQSVSIAGRSVTKSSLTDLRALRTELLEQLAFAQNGGRPSVASFRKPSGGSGVSPFGVYP